MDKKISGIYSITNKINGKKYIGSSKNIPNRYGNHLSLLRNNTHRNKHLQNVANKYGIENLIFEIIELVDNNQLLFREQLYINKYKCDMLYNKTKIAGSSGANINKKKLYVIDLEGNIIKRFSSGIDVAKFLNMKNIEYSKINTKSIKRKKYRLVTPEFYNDNIDEIKSWRSYSNIQKHKKIQFKFKKYVIYNGKERYQFNTFREISKFLKITHQRVSQIYKLIDNSNNRKFFHKKSGFYLAYVN